MAASHQFFCGKEYLKTLRDDIISQWPTDLPDYPDANDPRWEAVLRVLDKAYSDGFDEGYDNADRYAR